MQQFGGIFTFCYKPNNKGKNLVVIHLIFISSQIYILNSLKFYNLKLINSNKIILTLIYFINLKILLIKKFNFIIFNVS